MQQKRKNCENKLAKNANLPHCSHFHCLLSKMTKRLLSFLVFYLIFSQCFHPSRRGVQNSCQFRRLCRQTGRLLNDEDLCDRNRKGDTTDLV